MLGTALALGMARSRSRSSGFAGLLLLIPLVTPEIVAGVSAFVLFAQVGVTLSIWTIILAHITFSISYVCVVVRGRLASMGTEIEEAALDLGATPCWLPADSPAGRPHIGQALVEAGVVGSVSEAFREILRKGGPYSVEKYNTPIAEAVGMIRAAGGVAVFAHPFARKRGDVVEASVLRELAREGLDGVEVDHPDHADDDPPRPCARWPRRRACWSPARATTTGRTRRRRSPWRRRCRRRSRPWGKGGGPRAGRRGPRGRRSHRHLGWTAMLSMQLGLEGMPARLVRVTPSRLATWEDCRRRYRLTYLDRPPLPRGGPRAASTLGAVVHNALQAVYGAPPARRSPARAAAEVDRQWSSEGFRDDAQAATHRERCPHLGRRLRRAPRRHGRPGADGGDRRPRALAQRAGRGDGGRGPRRPPRRA